MAVPTDFDRRRPLAANHVFEAHDQHDPTNRFLTVFRDESDEGVHVNFCEDTGNPHGLDVHDMIWLDVDQCEQFGNALLAAVKFCREQIA